MNRTLTAAALVAVATALPAVRADAQVDRAQVRLVGDWANEWRDSTVTAEVAITLLKETSGYARGVKAVGAIRNHLTLDGTPATRAALARGLADFIIGDTTDAAVRWRAAQILAGAAIAYTDGPPMSVEVRHQASFEALQRVFEAVEPPPLCDRGELDMEVIPETDPTYRPPCKRRPLRTAWCVAGDALHGPEVNKAMGRSDGGVGTPSPWDPPEVEGLSADAARWWSRCWDGRTPGEG